jgi:NADPH:quinone reductase
MRAVAFERNGGPEVLQVLDLPVPEPKRGQVLIRVAYAGVNFAEVFQRLGALGAVQQLTVPGLEVSGHVVKVGEGVEGLEAGEPVASLTHGRAGASGGYAEYAVAPADLVYPLRTAAGELELRAATALPCVVTTAYGLLSIAAPRDDETLLVHAAAGGVGSVTVQVARALGVGRVIGTVGSAEKVSRAQGYGYDDVYLRDEFAARVAAEHGERSVDVVLDSVAGRARVQSLDLLAPLGRLVVFGNAGREADIEVTATRLWLESRAILGYNIGEIAMRTPKRLRRHALAARDLMISGQVTIDVADVRPLAEAAEVHRWLEGGGTHGKLLLDAREAA